MAKHRTQTDFKKAHKPGCVVRCKSVYEDGNTCSYRWQAVEHARTNKKLRNIYDSHPDPNCHVDAEISASTKAVGWGTINADRLDDMRAKGITIISEGETYMSNSKSNPKLKQKVQTKGFVTGFSPYSNQAHHIIPTASLTEAISAAAASATNATGAIMTIRVMLLEEKYNINDKVNMIILPATWKPARLIGLPTHRGSHPNYNARVDIDTNDAVMKNYDPDESEHPTEDQIEEMAKALVRVSKKYLEELIRSETLTKIKNMAMAGSNDKTRTSELGINALYGG